MADPISPYTAEAREWQGMASDLGRMVRSPAVAAELVNLAANAPGQLVVRDGLTVVRFEEESVDDL